MALSPLGIWALNGNWVGISEKYSKVSKRIIALHICMSGIQMLCNIDQYNNQCSLYLKISKYQLRHI